VHKECEVVDPIGFEIVVIKAKEVKGNLKFLIADASGDYSRESISKIKFRVGGTRPQVGCFPLQ